MSDAEDEATPDEAEAESVAELGAEDAKEADEDDETNQAGEFSLVILDETKPTVDSRYFTPGAVEWRSPPIPLLFTTQNGNGHKGAELGGVIQEVWREDGKILGRGRFESGQNGQELRRLISEGVLTGVSADVGGAVVELEAATGKKGEMQRITAGKILGVTALPLQAYDDTRIAVTASAIPAAPPADWFNNPSLKATTPISVTADGRVFGHVAAWGTCHIGHKNTCLTPPRSNSSYSHFTIGEVLTAEGNTVPTGPITLGTGHAGLNLNANATRDHYDNTGTAVADVVAGEDEFGIWVAGAMRPSVTEERIREFRASAPSGDWRAINGNLEMVGVLAVNVPGFPIPRARVEFANDAPLALVAAGAFDPEEFVHSDHEDHEDCDCEEEKGEDCECESEPEELSYEEQLSALEEQIETLAAKMLPENEFRNYEISNAKSTATEIAGSHGHEPHGTSILWPAMYEELRAKGMTKEKSARISNAAWNKKHKAPGNATSTRVTASAEETANFTALIEEFVNIHTKRQRRDTKGRFADSGGLGSLTSKFKGRGIQKKGTFLKGSDSANSSNPKPSQQSAHGRPGKGIGGSPTRSGVSATQRKDQPTKKPGKKAERDAFIQAVKREKDRGWGGSRHIAADREAKEKKDAEFDKRFPGIRTGERGRQIRPKMEEPENPFKDYQLDEADLAAEKRAAALAKKFQKRGDYAKGDRKAQVADETARLKKEKVFEEDLKPTTKKETSKGTPGGTTREKWVPAAGKVGGLHPQSDPEQFTDEEIMSEIKYLMRLNKRLGSNSLRTIAYSKLLKVLADRKK